VLTLYLASGLLSLHVNKQEWNSTELNYV
jgi:hypothetical protein